MKKTIECESDIDYHLERIKALNNSVTAIFSGNKKEYGKLMAKVFLRNTGAINDHKGNYVINEKDLFAWFENLDYLRSYTIYDTL